MSYLLIHSSKYASIAKNKKTNAYMPEPKKFVIVV